MKRILLPFLVVLAPGFAWAGSPIAQTKAVDADATVVERVVAPRPATVMMLRRHAQVAAGDGIVMFGPVVTVRPEQPAAATDE